jgi:hypothetical protein
MQSIGDREKTIVPARSDKRKMVVYTLVETLTIRYPECRREVGASRCLIRMSGHSMALL